MVCPETNRASSVQSQTATSPISSALPRRFKAACSAKGRNAASFAFSPKHRRVGDAGPDIVDPDSKGTHFQRYRADHCVKRRLARRIGGCAGRRANGKEGGGVYDGTAAASITASAIDPSCPSQHPGQKVASTRSPTPGWPRSSECGGRHRAPIGTSIVRQVPAQLVTVPEQTRHGWSECLRSYTRPRKSNAACRTARCALPDDNRSRSGAVAARSSLQPGQVRHGVVVEAHKRLAKRSRYAGRASRYATSPGYM